MKSSITKTYWMSDRHTVYIVYLPNPIPAFFAQFRQWIKIRGTSKLESIKYTVYKLKGHPGVWQQRGHRRTCGGRRSCAWRRRRCRCRRRRPSLRSRTAHGWTCARCAADRRFLQWQTTSLIFTCGGAVRSSRGKFHNLLLILQKRMNRDKQAAKTKVVEYIIWAPYFKSEGRYDF